MTRALYILVLAALDSPLAHAVVSHSGQAPIDFEDAEKQINQEASASPAASPESQSLQEKVDGVQKDYDALKSRKDPFGSDKDIDAERKLGKTADEILGEKAKPQLEAIRGLEKKLLELKKDDENYAEKKSDLEKQIREHFEKIRGGVEKGDSFDETQRFIKLLEDSHNKILALKQTPAGKDSWVPESLKIGVNAIAGPLIGPAINFGIDYMNGKIKFGSPQQADSEPQGDSLPNVERPPVQDNSFDLTPTPPQTPNPPVIEERPPKVDISDEGPTHGPTVENDPPRPTESDTSGAATAGTGPGNSTGDQSSPGSGNSGSGFWNSLYDTVADKIASYVKPATITPAEPTAHEVKPVSRTDDGSENSSRTVNQVRTPEPSTSAKPGPRGFDMQGNYISPNTYSRPGGSYTTSVTTTTTTTTSPMSSTFFDPPVTGTGPSVKGPDVGTPPELTATTDDRKIPGVASVRLGSPASSGQNPVKILGRETASIPSTPNSAYTTPIAGTGDDSVNAPTKYEPAVKPNTVSKSKTYDELKAPDSSDAPYVYKPGFVPPPKTGPGEPTLDEPTLYTGSGKSGFPTPEEINIASGLAPAIALLSPPSVSGTEGVLEGLQAIANLTNAGKTLTRTGEKSTDLGNMFKSLPSGSKPTSSVNTMDKLLTFVKAFGRQ